MSVLASKAPLPSCGWPRWVREIGHEAESACVQRVLAGLTGVLAPRDVTFDFEESTDDTYTSRN